MLRILVAICLTARDALPVADNQRGRHFRDDLDQLIVRTEIELGALAQK